MTNLQDVLNMDSEEIEEQLPQEPTVDDVLADFDIDDLMDVGEQSMKDSDELRLIEGSSLKAEHFNDGGIILIPVQYRFTPEELSNKNLLAIEDQREKLQAFVDRSVNVVNYSQLIKVNLDKDVVDKFNEKLPEGQYLPSFMSYQVSKDPKDPITWLATKDKEFFLKHVAEERQPINTYNNNVTRPHLPQLVSRTNYAFINSLGALVYLKLDIKGKNKFETVMSHNVVNDGVLDKDTNTEFYGKAIKLDKVSGKTIYSIQILDNMNRCTPEQIERASKGVATEQGVSATDSKVYGIPKNSNQRQLLLRYFGVQDIYERETR